MTRPARSVKKKLPVRACVRREDGWPPCVFGVWLTDADPGSAHEIRIGDFQPTANSAARYASIILAILGIRGRVRVVKPRKAKR